MESPLINVERQQQLFRRFSCFLPRYLPGLAMAINYSRCTPLQRKGLIYQRKRPPSITTWRPLSLLMVPIVGFELTTYRLQGGCSTN